MVGELIVFFGFCAGFAGLSYFYTFFQGYAVYYASTKIVGLVSEIQSEHEDGGLQA